MKQFVHNCKVNRNISVELDTYQSVNNVHIPVPIIIDKKYSVITDVYSYQNNLTGINKLYKYGPVKRIKSIIVLNPINPPFNPGGGIGGEINPLT